MKVRVRDTKIGTIPGVVGIAAVFITMALPFPIAMSTSVDFVDAWLAVAGVGTAVLALAGAALRLLGTVHRELGLDEWGKWFGFLSAVTALAAAIAVIGSLSSWWPRSPRDLNGHIRGCERYRAIVLVSGRRRAHRGVSSAPSEGDPPW